MYSKTHRRRNLAARQAKQYRDKPIKYKYKIHKKRRGALWHQKKVSCVGGFDQSMKSMNSIVKSNFCKLTRGKGWRSSSDYLLAFSILEFRDQSLWGLPMDAHKLVSKESLEVLRC